MAPLIRVGSISAHDSTAIAVTALTGTRLAATARHSRQPGTARSREKANSMREAAVRDAVPQKNWATTAMNSNSSAHTWPSAVDQT